MSLFGSISDFISGGNQSAAADSQQAAVDALASLSTPDIADMQLQLETLVQQGILTPEQAQVYAQDPSAMAGISTDPRLQAAQYDALASLQDISDSGGMTAADKANLSRIATDEATKSRGSREAILQNMEARGAGGSGASMLAQLQNSQDAASRQSQRDLDVAGMAQSRALQALQGAGSLGGQMQQTSFNQQAQQAGAQDAINQFNTQNRNQLGLANTQAKNQAAAQNLSEKQRIADAGVNTRNQQQANNKSLLQQDFENRYRKAGGQAAALNNQANQFNQTGQQTTKVIGELVSKAASAYAGAGGGGVTDTPSDKNLKKDIESFDASAFLDSITPSRYNYKNPAKHGEGPQVGVMAQDIEKEVPQMIEEHPDGKYVNYNKAGGPIFASLADLHKRIKELEGDEE